MSIAAIQPPVAIFREEQRFGWWVYALLAFTFFGAWWLFLYRARPEAGAEAAALTGVLQIPIYIGLGLTLPVLLFVFVVRMTTEVSATQVRIWFGWIPSYRRAILLAAVQRVEAVQFHPWKDHRLCNILTRPDGERVYTARGTRGVRLHLIDGSRILIGSQRPEELALTIEGALRPAV